MDQSSMNSSSLNQGCCSRSVLSGVNKVNICVVSGVNYDTIQLKKASVVMQFTLTDVKMNNWKDVVGYEDLFKVSDTGLIFSKRSSKELKVHLNNQGYLCLATRIGGRKGKPLCFKIHRLVAEAFLPPPRDLLISIADVSFYKKVIVNHIDGNKTNNHIKNLEWSSPSENTKHAVSLGLLLPMTRSQNGMSKFSNEEDRELFYRKFIESGESMRSFAEKNHTTHSLISRLVQDFSKNKLH